MITWMQLDQWVWLAVYENGILVGEAYTETDGFLVFCFDDSNKGFIASHILRQLADGLDFLNEPWRESLDRFFDSIEGS